MIHDLLRVLADQLLVFHLFQTQVLIRPLLLFFEVLSVMMSLLLVIVVKRFIIVLIVCVSCIVVEVN